MPNARCQLLQKKYCFGNHRRRGHAKIYDLHSKNINDIMSVHYKEITESKFCKQSLSMILT